MEFNDLPETKKTGEDSPPPPPLDMSDFWDTSEKKAADKKEEKRTPAKDGRLSCEDIAIFAYETIYNLHKTLGSKINPAWEDLSDREKADKIKLVNQIIQTASAPLTQELAQSAHDAWHYQKIIDGWTYGENLDELRKKDPRMIPFPALPTADKMRFLMFRSLTIQLLPLWAGY